MSGGLWHHVYATVVPEDNGAWYAGCYAQVTAGDSPVAPEDLPTKELTFPDGTTLAWVASFDHQPTGAELDALRPEEFRDPDGPYLEDLDDEDDEW